MRHLAILALLLGACGSGSSAAPARTVPPATAPATAPSADRTCPSAQPTIDSSCESFEVGLGCLYADNAVGCSCMATTAAERSADNPWKQVWRCGEHGEGE